MNNDINVFHHLGIISRDMDAAVKQYEQLGFVFTPLTIPRIPLRAGADPEPLGAGNRCAIFRNNYLEILGIVDATRWASITREQRGPFDLDEPLQRYEGLHVLHLGTNDLNLVRDRLQQRGLEPTDIRPFHRLVDTADGRRMMRAKTLSFPQGTNPEALMQIAQHETPEIVLQPRYMNHPNGAISITEVIVCVQDPDGVARKYGLYTDQAVQRRGALHIVEFGVSRIIVVNPSDLPEVLPRQVAPTVPFLAGFTVASDLEITERALEEREIDFRIHNGRMHVNPTDGYGAAVVFENADSSLIAAA